MRLAGMRNLAEKATSTPERSAAMTMAENQGAIPPAGVQAWVAVLTEVGEAHTVGVVAVAHTVEAGRTTKTQLP